MSPVVTTAIGEELCQALGLPADKVTSIDLRFPANGIVTAAVEFLPERSQLDEVVNILRRYELHEKQDERPRSDQSTENLKGK